MKHVINLVAIVLISMSTVGCSISAIARVKTETRPSEQISRRDLQLKFNAAGDSLSVHLQYKPYFNVEKRDIYPTTSAYDFAEMLVVAIYGASSLGIWINAMEDPTIDGFFRYPTDRFGQRLATEDNTWWGQKTAAQKIFAIALPIDWALFWIVGWGRSAWQLTEEETPGEWQALSNHRYHIELPTYNFSKDYRSTSGTERIALREFLNGIKLQNPKAFLERDAFTLRAATVLDGKTYGQRLTISTQAGLQPFRDVANAALGYDMLATGLPQLAPRAEAVAHWTKGTVTAGQTATLNVTVRNTGKGELYRVTALTVSPQGAFNNKELRFGKITPGASKTLRLSFPIDKLMRTRDISLRIRFSEHNDYVPEDVVAKLQVVGQPRPKFDYNYRVVDGGTRDSVGNGDGILQHGESVDIQVTVRNSGAGTATGVNTRLKLRSASGVTQHGTTEMRFASIAPGDSKTATFNIGVKPRSISRSLTLDLAVTEEMFGTEVRLVDKITLPIGQVAAPKIAVLDGQATIIAESATLRDGADNSTPALAEIPKNTRVHITGQLGRDWYRVALGELTGWVHTRDLTTRPVATTSGTGTQSQKVQIIEVYQKQAPVVTLVEPTQSRVRVEGRTLALTATAVDDKGITRVELTVNEEVIEKAGRGMRAAAAKDRTIKETIPLTYGENTIRLVVYDTDDQASQPLIISATRTREQPRQDYALLFATDTYDAWKSLKNPIHDAQTIGNELENRYGFAVELVRNPTRAEIFTKLREYAQKRYSGDDQLLVFFAGHGHFDELLGIGHLIAKDSNSAVRDPSMSSAIQHSQLHPMINNIPCEHIFLVIDACFSGTFDERVAQRGEPGDTSSEEKTAEFIQDKLAIKTRWYLTSGGKEYVSDGKPGAHSPFARNMLEALRSNGGEDGVLTLSELEGYVEKTEPRPQAGEFGDNEPGSNFLFIQK